MPDVVKKSQDRKRVDAMLVAVNALGITQITAWATIVSAPAL